MSAWKEWVSEYKNARRAPASTVRNRPWPGKKKRPWKLYSENYSYTVGVLPHQEGSRNSESTASEEVYLVRRDDFLHC